MNKYQLFCFLSVTVALSISTSARAEVVSTKAADLVGTQANNQLTVAQTNDSVPQNAKAADSQKPESNYWYLSGSVGASIPSDVELKNDAIYQLVGQHPSLGLNTAFQSNIAAGYQWEQARAELELGYGSYGVNSVKVPGLGSASVGGGSINAITLMANGYWDIPTGSKWSPYLGAGIGVGFVNFGDGSPVKGNALALQGKAGIQYEVTKKGNAFLELKYQNIGGFSSDSDIGKVDVGSTSSFGIGVGYRQGF